MSIVSPAWTLEYGVNVAIAIIAAVAIAILINWISYNNFRTGGTRWELKFEDPDAQIGSGFGQAGST